MRNFFFDSFAPKVVFFFGFVFTIGSAVYSMKMEETYIYALCYASSFLILVGVCYHFYKAKENAEENERNVLLELKEANEKLDSISENDLGKIIEAVNGQTIVTILEEFKLQIERIYRSTKLFQEHQNEFSAITIGNKPEGVILSASLSDVSKPYLSKGDPFILWHRDHANLEREIATARVHQVIQGGDVFFLYLESDIMPKATEKLLESTVAGDGRLSDGYFLRPFTEAIENESIDLENAAKVIDHILENNHGR